MAAGTYHYGVHANSFAYSDEQYAKLQAWAREHCKNFWTNHMYGGSSHGTFTFTCSPAELSKGLKSIGIDYPSSTGIEIQVNRHGEPASQWPE